MKNMRAEQAKVMLRNEALAAQVDELTRRSHAQQLSYAELAATLQNKEQALAAAEKEATAIRSQIVSSKVRSLTPVRCAYARRVRAPTARCSSSSLSPANV